MSIATSYQNDTWITPIYYIFDNKYLYFVSSIHSKHVQHIQLNKKVAVSIFDSSQTDNINGIQMKGEVVEIPISEYSKILELYFYINETINEKISEKISEYKKNKRAIFQVKPIEIYIQDVEYFKKYHIDRRIKVTL